MAEQKAVKSNATVIQAVKAVAVLVIICLVCGLLLALCNDLLYVSDAEKFNRAMKKIYPNYEGDEEYNSSFVLDGPFSSATGKILSVNKSTDGAYVFEAQGEGGYKGAITLYVVLKEITVGNDTGMGIYGWTIKEHNGETLLSNIDTSWYINNFVKDYPFNLADYKVADVTKSSSAINNAVNMVCSYAIYKGLASNDLADAQSEALALLEGKGYTSLDVITTVQNLVGTSLDGADDSLTYLLAGTNAAGTSAIAYVYGEGKERKVVVVVGDEILTNANCDASADFYQLIKDNPIREISVTNKVKLYTFVTGIDEGGEPDEIVYTVVGLRGTGYDPDNYTLLVTIKDGAVTNLTIAPGGDGWADGYEDEAPHDKASVMIGVLKGATLDTIDSLYADNENKWADTTQSANIITAAVKAALYDYSTRNAAKD